MVTLKDYEGTDIAKGFIKGGEEDLDKLSIDELVALLKKKKREHTEAKHPAHKEAHAEAIGKILRALRKKGNRTK